MDAQMNDAQYNTLITAIDKLGGELHMLKEGQHKLEYKLGGELHTLKEEVHTLKEGQHKLEEKMQEQHQGTIRWVMSLFVAALLVNGPVIGAIVSFVILKLN